MNYYPFNIGDYGRKAKHLSPMEDLVYRRLLDLYYTHELPLPLPIPRTARLICLPDHQAEVTAVLSEFFEKTSDGWRNAKCDEVIAAYKKRVVTATTNGKLGGRKAWRLPGQPVDYPLPTGSVPIGIPEGVLNKTKTNKQKKQQPDDAIVVLPEWIPADLWRHWREHRSRLGAPLTRHGEKLLLAKLAKLREIQQDPAKVIEQSIEGGWKGLFELKDYAKQGAGQGASRVSNPVVAWFLSDAGVLAKGRELGMEPRVGEDMGGYKDRIFARLKGLG